MNSIEPSVSECKTTIRRHDAADIDLLIAAAMLMENCETDTSITIDDGLVLLDRCGAVAEMGARILFVLTGRDGLGWSHAGQNRIAFQTDKQNWLVYLSSVQGRGEHG